MAKAVIYETLGDIAAELAEMKAQGMTRQSVIYALDRVFWEDEISNRKAWATFKSLHDDIVEERI